MYDQETEYYYVSSRYYAPKIGRWINADDTAYLGADGTLLSYNLFAYCKNNPVLGYDPTGHFSWTDVFNTAAVVTIAALAVIAIVGSGGSAAPPLLAAATASILESSSKQGKDYVQARNNKHRRCTPTALVRSIPETFKGLGLSQQPAFCTQKTMLAGWLAGT